MVSQHALQVSRPTPRVEVEGSGWGVSRPTPEGEVEGSGLGGSPGPHPGGHLQAHTWGGLQTHTQGGVSQHALRQTHPPPMATAVGCTHPTGMHSCCLCVRWCMRECSVVYA